MGEALGTARSIADGKPRSLKAEARDNLDDGTRQKYWIPDGRSGDLRLEDKFGIKPRLSPNQIFARDVLGSNFQLNSFVPADVGKLLGMPAGAVAPQVIDQMHAYGQ